MQLPRGTFHSIRKHVTFQSLLDEASSVQYTGSMLISFREGVASLVLETGRTVLATYKGTCGREALQQIEQMGDVRVDAELTLLNESQMALAKEFNKSCRTHFESGVFFGKTEPSREPLTEPSREPLTEPSRGSLQEQKTIIRPVSRVLRTPQRTFSEGEVDHLLNGDLDALDRMDLAKISGKFRMNAKSIARELNLDNLGDG
jgi:hypothetical protein